ncbi:hypothetical protein F5Y06DRAFT_123788 [Hypoxylon sp. FL0890]|nr:hypothetical protein F5Y06DRAFT_123788 [Hypoxylon sp. FL0890]
MGDQSVPGFFQDGRLVADQFSTSVHGAVTFANQVQNTLDDIKDNTKRLFWWTSTFICVCLGLFLLGQLVRLRRELRTLVQYQEVFRQMWDEDKELERERVDELRRHNDMEEQRRRARAAAQARGGLGGASRGRGGFGTSSQSGWATEGAPYTASSPSPGGEARPSPFGAGLSAALDSAPPPGPDRDEWIRQLASMTLDLRQAQQGQQGQQGEQEDDVY